MMSFEYEYHDADLVSVSFGPRHECSFTFDLYSIYYPDTPTVALRFGGVYNHDSVQRFVGAINDDQHDPNSYLTRCNTIHLDTMKVSRDGDMYVFIDLSYYGAIRIHCQHVSESCV